MTLSATLRERLTAAKQKVIETMAKTKAETKALPVYRSHKKVQALQIKEVHLENGTLTFVREGYKPLTIDRDWIIRFAPFSGGYYVKYADGYESFSPKEQFEADYDELVTQPQAPATLTVTPTNPDAA